jgi:hypothetical protein
MDLKIPKTSEAQRKASQKWRDANRQKYNEYTLMAVKRWAEKNKNVIKEKKKEYYVANKAIIKEKNKARYYIKKQLKADTAIENEQNQNNEEIAIIKENEDIKENN